MASSDDEAETIPQSVSNHHFVDNDGAPISFAVLPIMLDDAKKVEAPRKQVSVRGTTDGGLQAVFKEVVAWKLRLDGRGPEISVLCKDKNWIKLGKPKKRYEECIRTTLMTIHLLHFLKKNPEASMKSFCEYLRLALSSSDDKICKYDFRDHIQLVKLFLKRDETLAKSQILRTIVKDLDNAFVEDFFDGVEERPFIVDDKLDGIGIDGGNDFEDESDIFDHACAICDNGGELLCCEGSCMRSFHATREAGQDSNCASLGLTRTEVEAMQNFVCKNCQLKHHQCFACGKLGSSDKSAKAEVFSCISANCGHFYHPKCVAELVFPENKAKATELEKKIAAGESFTCPVHICTVCKQIENMEVEELQFAICRRCPKAYHRKCLPRKIGFNDIEEENVIQRAWEGLLPNNRILAYCLKHDIVKELATPPRNHITFPELPERKREVDGQRTKTKKNKLVSNGMNRDLNIVKPVQRTEKFSTKDGSHTLLIGPKTFVQIIKDSSQHKIKTPMKDAKSALKKVNLKEIVKFRSTKIDKPTIDIEKAVLHKAKVADSTVSLDAKLINSAPKILPDIRKDVLDLGEEESSSLTQDDIKKTLSTPCTHASSSGHIDKTTTLPIVQGAIEDVDTALEKIEGHSVEYAKAEPEILKQVTDKLHWYVQDGDMVVDFSHGKKEFSLLMKAELDAAGKNCSLKNYDILQSKNDFNFEMRDWMTVQPKELPTGTKLIMVLNPPFGANVHLVNQLIDKALTFKSKLLVLIVPEETRRLDKKNSQYNLIWEDSENILGKQMEQWNVKPAVLYLWSRSDWTAVHKGIALSQGHISRMQPALLIHKKAQEEGGEDAPIVDKNTEERYKEKDATQSESMSSTKQGIAVQAQVQVERRNDSPQVEKHLIEMYEGINAATEPLETRKVDNNKNYIQETSKKRETIPPQKESRKEVDNRKQHSEERPKKKRDVVRGEKVIWREACIQKFGQSYKQESADIHKDKPPVKKKIKQQQQEVQDQQQQETFPRIDTDDPRDMSISPPDRTAPVDLFTGQGPALGVSETPLVREILYGGCPTSKPEIRMMPSVGSHDEVDDIRRYATVERDNLYINSPHGWSGVAINKDAYNHNRVIDVCGRHSEVDSRAHCMQANEISNGNEINSDADIRTQHRTCTMQHEVVENVCGKPLDTTTYLIPYRGMHDGEDHPQRSRFSLRGSQSTSGHSPTSTYRFTNPAAETSASQPYAPRLDEVNYLRPSQWSPGIPLPERDVRHDMHDTKGGIPLDASVFASKAYPPFPNQGSCGWISD